MSALERLEARIRARPPEADFGDVARLLQAHGWTKGDTKGSHTTFRKPGRAPITVSTVSGKRVKRYQLDKIIEHLGLD